MEDAFATKHTQTKGQSEAIDKNQVYVCKCVPVYADMYICTVSTIHRETPPVR